METWNREALYREVWDQPLVKLAPKYGISAVALGKVCDKLQIPLPGRGYWVKKEFGKPTTSIWRMAPIKDCLILKTYRICLERHQRSSGGTALSLSSPHARQAARSLAEG